MLKKYGFQGAATLAILTAAGSAAWAQTEQRISGLEEIVVTAERREGNLQTVPIAVSALTPSTLENIQIGSSQDLQKIIPGLRMVDGIATPTNFTIALRGSIQQDSSVIVVESPVGIYVDDVYIPRLNGANSQLLDIERVEVLRGPQGTLYGRNTLSGALKFVTRTPGEESWLQLRAGYGSYNRVEVGGSVGGKIADDVYASISGLFNDFDGYYENVATGEDFGEERNAAVRGKLRFTPGEWDIAASFSYARSTHDGQVLVPGLVPAAGQFTSDDVAPLLGADNPYRVSIPTMPRSGIVTDEPYGKTTQMIATLSVSRDLGFATARSISGWVQTKDFFSNDLSGRGAFPLASDMKSDAFSEELQLIGTALDDRLDWMFGVYYFHEKADQELQLVTLMPTAIKTDSIAAFGQATYDLTSDLSFTAGLRWTQDKKRFTGGIRGVDFPFPDVDFTSRDTYRAWTPKFSLNYDVPVDGISGLDSLFGYISASRGFKSGGYNGIPVVSPGVLETVYRPETNWTYEAGLKTEFLDRRMRLNAAYFINRISDLTANATVDVGGTPVFPVTNVGDATVKGLELEFAAVPLAGLNLFANATFQTGKYRNLIEGSTPALAEIAFGKAEIPQLPDYSFTIGFDYSHDLTLGNTAAVFKIGGDWYRADDHSVLVNNDFRVTAYSRLNGFVAMEIDERYELRLAGSNLADKKKFISGSRDTDLEPGRGGYILLPPREIMLSFSYRM